MKRTVIILDDDPNTKHLWTSWEARKARIEGDLLVVEWPHGTLNIRSSDPQLLADMFFAHDPQSEIVKGRLGITGVSYEEKKDSDDLPKRFAAMIREILKTYDT